MAAFDIVIYVLGLILICAGILYFGRTRFFGRDAHNEKKRSKRPG